MVILLGEVVAAEEIEVDVAVLVVVEASETVAAVVGVEVAVALETVDVEAEAAAAELPTVVASATSKGARKLSTNCQWFLSCYTTSRRIFGYLLSVFSDMPFQDCLVEACRWFQVPWPRYLSYSKVFVGKTREYLVSSTCFHLDVLRIMKHSLSLLTMCIA